MKPRILISIIGALLWLGLGGALPARARSIASDYPRLANVYLTPTISLSEARSLARWDALILGLEVQYTSPDSLRLIRQLHPDIIILAYVLSEEIPDSQFTITDSNHPHYQLVHDMPDGWWLRDAQGGRVSFWPGSHMVNITPAAITRDGEHWHEYLARFMHERVMATGLWDGIFYDNAFRDISWFNNGNLDLNNDGQAEPASQLDQSWRDGMSELFRLSRRLEGAEALIIGNGAEAYLPLINGRLIEEFPSAYDQYWPGAMQRYNDAAGQATPPALVIINSKTTTGAASDYRQMRLNLCSTLLGNGFASFDYGSLRHADLWWYDEYDTFLGSPLGSANNLLHPATTAYEPSVWRRDFTNAIVLVNSTTQARKIDLGGGFERIDGQQDRGVNNGAIVTSVWVPPNDGIILLKKQIVVRDGAYINGALGLAFDEQGHQQRQGFFTTNANFAGGVKVNMRDINNDGNLETVVGWNNKVQIYDSRGFLTKEFYPYGRAYRLGVNVALGDLDGNGTDEIITGTGRGAGPQVRIFDASGQLRHPGWFAYDAKFRGGVNVAAGDLNDDGRAEIIVGAGFGGGPQVRIFNAKGKAIGGFFAYDKKFRGGVSVAAGDVNADGRAEIVTGPGPGGGPQVRIFNGQGRALTPGFFAYAKNFRAGVTVNIADVNNDGVADILVGASTIY